MVQQNEIFQSLRKPVYTACFNSAYLQMKRFIIKTAQIRKYASDAVLSIKGEDCLEVIIRPYVDDQTSNQRSFFHVLVGIMAKECGNTPNEMKIAIKEEHYGYESVEVLGKTRTVLQSTTKNNKEDYSALIETTYRIGAELGIILPPPYYNER